MIGEPDFVMDTVPYYLDNPIYFPRGRRYGSWTLFTQEWRPLMTVDEALANGGANSCKYFEADLVFDRNADPLEARPGRTGSYQLQSALELEQRES